MRKEGVEPRQSAFVMILGICGDLGNLEQGRQLHNCVVKTGFVSNIIIGNALVTMYAKCGSLEFARHVFDRMPEQNVVSWTAMIAGYNQNGRVDDACNLFDKMPQKNVVSWNAMISGLAKNGRLVEALQLFAEMPDPNAVTWNGIITGYAQNGYCEEALKFFSRMQQGGIKPDFYTFSSILQACASLAAMENGYAQHGHGSEALSLFELMKQSSLRPDAITFMGVLVACSHAGLVDEGRVYFDSMSRDHGIVPGVDHYACMVDLLGRGGYFDEAECFINKLPVEPDAVTLKALLGACRIHSNLKLSIRVAERLLDLEPKNASTYVLLANNYAAAGRWDDVSRVRLMMRDKGIKKEPGYSWIEFQNRVHRFVVDDTSHPQTLDIYKILERLSEQIKEAGYVPETNFVLHDIEGKQKEHMLCFHSEKLAIAFGIINIPLGATIRVIKNLRMCGDCHTATKFISKTVGREIVVRDASRFHHFMNGCCSCKDYW